MKMSKIALITVEEMHIYWKHGQTFHPCNLYKKHFLAKRFYINKKQKKNLILFTYGIKKNLNTDSSVWWKNNKLMIKLTKFMKFHYTVFHIYHFVTGKLQTRFWPLIFNQIIIKISYQFIKSNRKIYLDIKNGSLTSTFGPIKTWLDIHRIIKVGNFVDMFEFLTMSDLFEFLIYNSEVWVQLWILLKKKKKNRKRDKLMIWGKFSQ